MPCDCDEENGIPIDGQERLVDLEEDLAPGAPGTVTLVYLGNATGLFNRHGPSGRLYTYGAERRIVTMLVRDAKVLGPKFSLVLAEVKK